MFIPFLALVDYVEAGFRIFASKKRPQGPLTIIEEPSNDWTIVISFYNEADRMGQCLDNFESLKDSLVLVDDGSTDNGHKIAQERGFKVILSRKNGKKVGSIGKVLESGEVKTTYTILMDLDTRLEDGYGKEEIGRLVQYLCINDLAGCGVRVLPEKGGNLLQKIQYLEYSRAMGIGRGSMHGEKVALNPCISGAFGVFDTKKLAEVTREQSYGGYHWEGEDFERTLRVLKHGWKTGYVDDFVVRTKIPKTLRQHFLQRIKWQAGALRNMIDFVKLLKRRDRLGATLWWNLIINGIAHPLKIFFLPALIMVSIRHPEAFPLFYGAYLVLGAVVAKSSLSDEDWKSYRKYLLIEPIYQLYHVVVLTTIGYIGEIVRRTRVAASRLRVWLESKRKVWVWEEIYYLERQRLAAEIRDILSLYKAADKEKSSEESYYLKRQRLAEEIRDIISPPEDVEEAGEA